MILIVLDIRLYIDGNDESLNANFIYPSLSNTNYSFRSLDSEISASSFSLCIGLEIDGVNKIIVYDRTEPYKVREVLLDQLDSESQDSSWNVGKVVSVNNVHTATVAYMSLIWANSKLPENKYLKDIALNIRHELFLEYQNSEHKHHLNILKAVATENPNFGLMYSLHEDSKEFIRIRDEAADISIISIEKAKRAFPQFSEEQLLNYRQERVRDILEQLSNRQDFDFKARIFLKSSVSLVKLQGRTAIDYSGIVIGYCKFIESEVNLSIVQGIRQALGIQMPKYYAKYCNNGKDFVFEHGTYRVDFNQVGYKYDYRAPSLGQSFFCLSYINKNAIVERQSDLSTRGIEFSKLRNKCAHTGLISVQDLDEAENFIAALFLNDHFEQMNKLKESLVGTPHWFSAK